MSNIIAFLGRRARQRRVLLRRKPSSRGTQRRHPHNRLPDSRSHSPTSSKFLLWLNHHSATEPADQFGPVVNARVSKVFCSSSCALAEPVAGLALAERFTDRAGMSGK